MLGFLDIVDNDRLGLQSYIGIMATAHRTLCAKAEAFNRQSFVYVDAPLQVTKRTVMCLERLTFVRGEIVGHLLTCGEDHRAVDPRAITWEERIIIFKEQSPETQEEIRTVFLNVLARIVEREWTQQYYQSSKSLMRPLVLREQYARIAVAFAMHNIVESWHDGLECLIHSRDVVETAFHAMLKQGTTSGVEERLSGPIEFMSAIHLKYKSLC